MLLRILIGQLQLNEQFTVNISSERVFALSKLPVNLQSTSNLVSEKTSIKLHNVIKSKMCWFYVVNSKIIKKLIVINLLVSYKTSKSQVDTKWNEFCSNFKNNEKKNRYCHQNKLSFYKKMANKSQIVTKFMSVNSN